MSKIADLTAEEMITAADVGVRRLISVLDRKQRNRHSPKDLGVGFQSSIIAAMAELVVAREFNLFWPDNVGLLVAGDVGGIIEVRCRSINGKLSSGDDLGFKLTDVIDAQGKPKNAPFVLVHADMLTFTFTMMGWIYAQDGWELGKTDEVRGVRYVKPGSLRDIDELHLILGR